MSTQTKGKCKYCGKEYTKAYMIRHMDSRKERKASIAAETGSKQCGDIWLECCGHMSVFDIYGTGYESMSSEESFGASLPGT